MALSTINGLLIGMVALVTAGNILVWHVLSEGRWVHSRYGVSAMALQGIILAITSLAVTTVFTGRFAYQAEIYAGLYCIFFAVQALILAHIITANRKGRDD